MILDEPFDIYASIIHMESKLAEHESGFHLYHGVDLPAIEAFTDPKRYCWELLTNFEGEANQGKLLVKHDIISIGDWIYHVRDCKVEIGRLTSYSL